MKDRGAKGFIILEWLIIVIVGGIVLSGMFTLVALALRPITAFPNYSTGERTGVVVKFSRKGLWYKTWEGSMNLGAMTTDDSGVAVPTQFDFTVADGGLVPVIQGAASTGERVTLSYNQAFIRAYYQGDTDYFVTSVRKAELKR